MLRTFLGRCHRDGVAVAMLGTLSFAVVAFCHAGISRSAEVKPPNIVLILADDLGWSDLGCYGNALIDTPHLDRLAQQGLRFTQAYAAAPICSASRASILTGKTPARLGFEFVTKSESSFQDVAAPLRAPPYTLNLPLAETTIAEALATANYKTAFFGKWHLNQHYQRYLGWSPTHGPKNQGFQIAEEDFGMHPYSYWSDRSERDFLKLDSGEYPADSLTQRASGFLHAEHSKPFFLMVSHFFVHTPVHTRIGWLKQDYERRFAEAMENGATPLAKGKSAADKWSHYAAMVTTLDHQVGQLLHAIDTAGLRESTIVIFTSDNGGHPEYAGNAPLRGSKWNLYEGGIRVPMIARWPGRIRRGATSDAIVTGTDLFPTLVALGTGADVVGASEIDGRSIAATWRENADADARDLADSATKESDRELVWHFPYYHPESQFAKAPAKIGVHDGVTSQTRPHSVLRAGAWKLIHFYESGRDELYHLDSDLAEQNDRSESDRDVAVRMRATLLDRLDQMGARLPVPNPHWQD
ncbi:MAG: sulfatase [Pirellulaceae bacterium]|nr:sulfatase [Pirellulaceae bacterium]